MDLAVKLKQIQDSKANLVAELQRLAAEMQRLESTQQAILQQLYRIEGQIELLESLTKEDPHAPEGQHHQDTA